MRIVLHIFLCSFSYTIRYKGTVIENRYGPGTGPIFFEKVRCVGTETSIDACTYKARVNTDCDHSRDVAVSCGSTPVIHGRSSLRLIRCRSRGLSEVPRRSPESQVKAMIVLYGKPHEKTTGRHCHNNSVTCHPAQANTSRLNPSQ